MFIFNFLQVLIPTSTSSYYDWLLHVLFGTGICSSFLSASFQGSPSNFTLSFFNLPILVSMHPNRSSMLEAPTPFTPLSLQFLGRLSLFSSSYQKSAALCPAFLQWLQALANFLLSFLPCCLYFLYFSFYPDFCRWVMVLFVRHFSLKSKLVSATSHSPSCVIFCCQIQLSMQYSCTVSNFSHNIHTIDFCFNLSLHKFIFI